LTETKVKAKLSIYFFCVGTLIYRTYHYGGRHLNDPAIVLSEQELPTLVNQTQVRGFLGLANYFRKCLP
jgi:hypothetical protein